MSISIVIDGKLSIDDSSKIVPILSRLHTKHSFEETYNHKTKVFHKMNIFIFIIETDIVNLCFVLDGRNNNWQ